MCNKSKQAFQTLCLPLISLFLSDEDSRTEGVGWMLCEICLKLGIRRATNQVGRTKAPGVHSWRFGGTLTLKEPTCRLNRL
jgi:hypothetical protein